MLFIIDMQNSYVADKGGDMYVENSETLVPGIIKRIDAHLKKGDEVFYTLDIYTKENLKVTQESIEGLENNNDLKNINIKEQFATEREKWGFNAVDELKPHLRKCEELKKSHYALPPEILLEIQQRFNKKRKFIEEIEFVGVETNVCVLANAICVRSAFPDAKIIINELLCLSNDMDKHKKALEIMESLGMEIRSERDDIR